MTDDPQSNSGAGGPSADESARPPMISHASGPPGMQVPASENGDSAKHQKSREFTAREMAGLSRQIAEIQSELARVESRLEETKLIGPDREKFRVQRNGLRERLEALGEAQDAGRRRLAQLDLLLHGDAATNALATRRGTQEAALLVADGIRVLLQEVAELWQRFQVLRREDEQLRDVVRSVNPTRMTEVSTFSWTTAVDEAFGSAIAEAISRSQRSSQDALAREKATSPKIVR